MMNADGAEPGIPVPIRPVTAADEDAVWPLARVLATSSEPTREAFARLYRATVDDQNAMIFLTRDPDSTVTGYVHVLIHPAFHADGNIGWVEELFVAEDRRGTGCGRHLMAAAEHWARSEHHAAYVALATRRAADFYLAVGYDESAVYLKKDLANSAGDGPDRSMIETNAWNRSKSATFAVAIDSIP